MPDEPSGGARWLHRKLSIVGLDYRDHMDGLFPLLPWLHSSEACEHVFGESRRIVKDFTMLDLLYMVPKLRVKFRAAVLLAKASDSKARAAEYTHTYFDNTGLDVLALSTFPSDDDMKQPKNLTASLRYWA
jgi:hypothetical protein